ncbi:MAG: hypothetical protein R3A48_04215 [Polyangiales bacterium]
MLDVKVGSGAFANQAQARELATALVEVATGAGKRCVALAHPHGPSAGVRRGQPPLGAIEAFECSTGAGPPTSSR